MIGNPANRNRTVELTPKQFHFAFTNTMAGEAARADYMEFAGRPHFTVGAPGWEDVADYALDWANRHTGAPAESKEPASA